MIAKTERLFVREMDSALDAEFVFELLNSPKFLKYIGDRGVRSVEQAADFIETRYRQSYRDHGYGLWTVTCRDGAQVGICGFVRRPHLDSPDLGFAFLPEYERLGYGYESAKAVIAFAKSDLAFSRVLAITSQDNDASGKLLEKLGFGYDGIEAMPDGEELKVYSIIL